MLLPVCPFLFFFFNDTATTEIYTLSLHDALPISAVLCLVYLLCNVSDQTFLTNRRRFGAVTVSGVRDQTRSEEHTSELQSRLHLVCRLLLEKKKKNRTKRIMSYGMLDLYLNLAIV